MNNSAFHSPSPRQVELRRQMKLAKQQGDQRLITLLEGQWVHRYGVASLPLKLNTTASISAKEIRLETAVVPVQRAEEEVQSVAAEEIKLAADPFAVEGRKEPEPVSEDLPAAENLVVPTKPFGRVATFFKGCLDEVSSTLTNDETLSIDKLGQGQACLEEGAVTPPPPPSIKHLRRWLPSAEDQLNKAS